MKGNIILIGMKHVGKTTLALELKEKLGWDIVVLDSLIEHAYKELNGEIKNCREIVQLEGEEYFRTLETEVLGSLQCQKAIIDTGGGILETEENRELVKKLGHVIWLTMDRDENFSYIVERGIPSFYDQENPRKSFDEILERRSKYYEEVANMSIDVSGNRYKEAAEEIMGEYRL